MIKIFFNNELLTDNQTRLIEPLTNWLGGQEQILTDSGGIASDGKIYLGKRLESKTINLRFLVEDNDVANKILNIQRLRQKILTGREGTLQIGDIKMIDGFNSELDNNGLPIYNYIAGNCYIVGSGFENSVRYQGMGSMYVDCVADFEFESTLPYNVYGYQIKEATCCKGCPYSAYIRVRNCGGWADTGTLTLTITDGINTSSATATINGSDCTETCKWYDIKFSNFTGDEVSRISSYTLSGSFSEEISFWIDALTIQDCINVTKYNGVFNKLVDADPTSKLFSDVSADFFIPSGYGELALMDWVDSLMIDDQITEFKDVLPQSVAYKAKTTLILFNADAVERVSLTNQVGGICQIADADVGGFSNDPVLVFDHSNGNVDKSDIIASRVKNYGSCINMFEYGVDANLIINDGILEKVAGGLATQPDATVSSQNTKTIETINRFFIGFIPTQTGELAYIDLVIAGGNRNGVNCIVCGSINSEPSFVEVNGETIGICKSSNTVKLGNQRSLKRFLFSGVTLTAGTQYFITLNADNRNLDLANSYSYVAYNDSTTIGHSLTNDTVIFSDPLSFGDISYHTRTQTPLFQVYSRTSVGTIDAECRRVLTQLV